jgi:hypothetical protein
LDDREREGRITPMDLRERGFEDGRWIELAVDRAHCRLEVVLKFHDIYFRFSSDMFGSLRFEMAPR